MHDPTVQKFLKETVLDPAVAGKRQQGIFFFHLQAPAIELEIWISKIARIADLCTSSSCSFSLLPSVASTSCWWEWCNVVLLNFLQEQFFYPLVLQP